MMTPDASALLAWLVERGGTALQRDIGDTAPRRFRKAGVYAPLVAELLAAGAIVETCTRPRTFSVAEACAPKPSSGNRLLDRLADAMAECGDMPEGLAAYWSSIVVRDKLVARMLASNGLPTDCACRRAAHAVDRAVVEAFDCEMPD